MGVVVSWEPVPLEGVRVVVAADDRPGETATARLVERVGDGRSTVIVVPDGLGGEVRAVAAAAARRTGADLWARGTTPPHDYELTLSADCRDDVLDRLHDEHEDPWGVETRWYEQRKRELVLAMLPRPRFERVVELGCSTGALAHALASRSTHVLAVDSSPSAVSAARRRFRADDRVTVAELDLPTDWPADETFDLVVVSEVGYFLSPPELEGLVGRVAGSLAAGGVVVLCHWRHPIDGRVLDGSDVHEGFRDPRLPPVAASYRDRDVEIVVLAAGESWPDPGE